jgi:hypothetical protein
VVGQAASIHRATRRKQRYALSWYVPSAPLSQGWFSDHSRWRNINRDGTFPLGAIRCKLLPAGQLRSQFGIQPESRLPVLCPHLAVGWIWGGAPKHLTPLASYLAVAVVLSFLRAFLRLWVAKNACSPENKGYVSASRTKADLLRVSPNLVNTLCIWPDRSCRHGLG